MTELLLGNAMGTDDKARLSDSPGFFEALVASSQEIFTIVDRDSVVIFQSAAIKTILGFSAEEMVGKDSFSLMHPDDVSRIERGMQRLIQNPEQPWSAHLRMRCKDGTWRHISSVLSNELDNPAIKGVLIVTRDSTAEEQANRDLRNSEQHFRTVVSHQNIILWALDPDGTIRVSEGKGLAALGLEAGALVGSNFFELYAARPDLVENVRRALAGEDMDYTASVPGADGDVTLENRLRPQFADDGSVVAVTCLSFDITGRLKLENQLRRARTLEAIGLLAGGVAHDFNNLLTAIMGFAAAAKNVDGARKIEYLDYVLESADRGAALVGQLLSFARKDEIHPETVDLRSFVEDLTPIIRQVCGETIEVEIVSEQGAALAIEIDRSKLEQVLVNLATNARDAMPDGGLLRFRLSRDGHVGPTSAAAVQLEVSDTGIGMEQSTLDCIFEPFYSTKDEGSGLGLATSHGIVTRAGGSMVVTSSPGKGTLFRIAFPPASSSAPGKAAMGQVFAAGHGSVLLVDDNIAVLESTQLILEAHGFGVIPARSGQEGYDLFVKHRDTIDLIMTDMTMPGMKGGELAQLVRKLDENIPILLVSGNHEYPVGLESMKNVVRVSKPYRGGEPLLTLSRLLTATSS